MTRPSDQITPIAVQLLAEAKRRGLRVIARPYGCVFEGRTEALALARQAMALEIAVITLRELAVN